jgi:acetyl esterase
VKPLLTVLTSFCICFLTNAQSQESQPKPDIRTFKTVGTTKLTAHIFRPKGGDQSKLAPVIVLFHGGGWSVGSPEWTYPDAQRYASYGAVAVAAQYRLCDQSKVTPMDSMADARDLIVWLRANSKELGIDPSHLAAYGVSAGGHLAAALATIPDPEHPTVDLSPQALVRSVRGQPVNGCPYRDRQLLDRGGNSNALCGIPFWEAKRGLHVEFGYCRFHIDVE